MKGIKNPFLLSYLKPNNIGFDFKYLKLMKSAQFSLFMSINFQNYFLFLN